MLRSRYFLNQAAFILLMTWVNTIAYFCQTDLVACSYSTIADRARAIADIDLVVNACTAAILLLGLGRFMRRFGVTPSLLLNPILMVIAFIAAGLSPTLLMIQVLQIVRRVAQYAIARRAGRSISPQSIRAADTRPRASSTPWCIDLGM